MLPAGELEPPPSLKPSPRPNCKPKTRHIPIHARAYSAEALNQKYVVPQWPLNPSLPSPHDPNFAPGSYENAVAGDRFPQTAANVTMETCFQTSNGCMQCHYHAAAYGVDYSSILYNRVSKAHQAAQLC